MSGKTGSQRIRRKEKKSNEFPDSYILLDELQEMISEAITFACGEEFVNVLNCSGSSVQVTDNWRVSGDFKCLCAHYIFSRFLGKRNQKSKSKILRQQKKNNRTKEKCERKNVIPVPNNSCCMTVEVTSDFGVNYTYTYQSPKQVAEAIIKFLPEKKMHSLVSNVKIERSGLITFTTKQHLHWHIALGRLPCTECGLFFKGSRGLRMHQMGEHGAIYEEAQKEVNETEMQLISFKENQLTMQKLQGEIKRISRARDYLGDSGLEATRSGDLEKVKMLVDRFSWDPNQVVDKHGSTGFMWAAGEGHLHICQYLVDHCGVDFDQMRGHAKRRRHALHWAARNGRLNICEWLVMEKGVDVDVGAEDGTTALHYAAWAGCLGSVKWLVEIGNCNVNKKNVFGCNASQWCALNGELDILKYLHVNCLDVKILNFNGHSALHKAATKGQFRICEWLLQPEVDGGGGLGLSHMGCDKDGSTPITLATANTHHELASMLSDRLESLSLRMAERSSHVTTENYKSVCPVNNDKSIMDDDALI